VRQVRRSHDAPVSRLGWCRRRASRICRSERPVEAGNSLPGPEGFVAHRPGAWVKTIDDLTNKTRRSTTLCMSRSADAGKAPRENDYSCDLFDVTHLEHPFFGSRPPICGRHGVIRLALAASLDGGGTRFSRSNGKHFYPNRTESSRLSPSSFRPSRPRVSGRAETEFPRSC
jgi:hypothetical protein